MKKAEPHRYRTLSQVVALVAEHLGDGASKAQVIEAIRDEATAAEWATWAEAALMLAVANVLLGEDAGLLPAEEL